MDIWIIITALLSLKSACEKDYYKFIGTNPPEELFKAYTAKELRVFLVDCVFRIVCTVYELIFYVVLLYNIRNIFVLGFCILHLGVALQELGKAGQKTIFDRKIWDRRVRFARIWGFSEFVFLSYLLYSLKKIAGYQW